MKRSWVIPFSSCIRGRGTTTTAATLALYCITFVIFLPLMCKDLPYSRYFHGEGNKRDIVSAVMVQNDRRIKLVTDYIANMNKQENEQFYKYTDFDDTDIAVGVVTMRRKTTERTLYLTQTVAAADMSFKQNTSYKKPMLFICNVDSVPANHQEAINLSKYYHIHAHYDDSGIQPDSDRFEKEKEDYSFCLIKALSYRPKYVLLLEDDAQPRENFFDNLKYLIDNRIDHHMHYDHESGDLTDWFLVKLYYPEKWIGYGNEADKILELVALGCIGGFIFYLIVRLPQSFIFGALYFILAALMIGRPYFVHLRRISIYFHRVLPAPGCCTQAILYTQQSARQVAHHLSTVTCTIDFSVDLAVDVLSQQSGGLAYVVEPNLVRHIGMVSSMRNTKKAAEFLE